MSRQNPSRLVANENGATIVVVAICLVFIISMAALAIDLGMLLTARAETQRAADAAALAGAAEYLDPSPTKEGAESRARAFAGKNFIRGNPGDADVVEVTVDEPNRKVTVRLQQPHDLWFARIFGINESRVGALAAAHVRLSGSAPCIRPFAIEHNVYTDEDIFKKVLLWESRNGTGSEKDNDDGYSRFILVGNVDSSPGVGNHIYKMITDTSCEFSNVKVGDEVPAKPGNNTLGNVKNGLKDLEKYARDNGYGELTWSETGPYDGFNKPDYLDDPRVALIPMYDPATLSTPWTGTDPVTITGFLRIALLTQMVDCKSSGGGNDPPCQFPGNGKRRQVYAVVLPSVGLSDVCRGESCSEINRTLQLIQ